MTDSVKPVTAAGRTGRSNKVYVCPFEPDLPAMITIWIMLLAAAIILIGVLEILDS